MRLPGTTLTLALAAGLALATAVTAQQPAKPEPLKIPENASTLEGEPTVKVDASEQRATRRQLGEAEAARNSLRIRIVDGRYFWASRDDRPLTLSTDGEFTYLLSGRPGEYVRFRKVNDRITYVEHLDTGFGSVTYWGELRIVIGK